jgi:predicted Zn-dependent protease
MKLLLKIILFLIFLFYKSINAYELPELGSSFDTLLNQIDEKKIKFQIMQQVYSSNTVIQDPEINDYLNNLGQNLIQNGTKNRPDINFFIVQDRSINAFAMLGNIIGVNSGLFFSANSESELASVLSHEIAHISQKHLLRLLDSQARNVYKSYLAFAVALLAARSNPHLSSSAIKLAGASEVQNILNFTRDNEKEADRIGLEILDKSGYDPKGFIDFFETIQRFNSFSSGAAPSFLRTHPITSERISDIQDRLKNYDFTYVKNKLEFNLTKYKLKAFIEDSDVESIFKNDLDSESDFNKPGLFLGLIYSLLLNNKISEARFYFNQLNEMNVDSPMIIELKAQLLIKEQKYPEAFDVYKEGINKYPYYRAFIIGISKLLINFNEADKVIELLKSYQLYFEKDPNFYDLLAKAYNHKKNFLLEHENLSDAYYFRYDLQNAISQMDLAVRVNSTNFYDQTRVEHRLKELKREAALMNN